MKTILLCLGMMMTASLFAHRIEFELNGGIGFITAPKIDYNRYVVMVGLSLWQFVRYAL